MSCVCVCVCVCTRLIGWLTDFLDGFLSVSAVSFLYVLPCSLFFERQQEHEQEQEPGRTKKRDYRLCCHVLVLMFTVDLFKLLTLTMIMVDVDVDVDVVVYRESLMQKTKQNERNDI